ncbi:MAG: nicotinate (nicotinamide) nucleotide adenylyltransferase [Clostridia bacterium]|nr:nicotinate (nicotinamide) nucleotide adenylyltransferase [Clostridia bacterium]
MMKIGIFGGSFDPVHKEHTNFARAAIAELGLDMLFVMPAHTPPHKPDRVLSSNENRLQMCKIAFGNIPKVQVSDYEINKAETSYTYLTCQHFRELYPTAEIYFLVGTDMLRDFPTWKEPETILNLVQLAVCGRNEKEGWWEEEQKAFFERFSKNFVRVDYEGKDISSTLIRVLAGAGMRLTEFVDERVEAYIYEKGLYKIENAPLALALETEKRKAHSVRVAVLAAKRALPLHISERKAITAALFHDCGKYLALDDPILQGFVLPDAWGEVPPSVVHQFIGAYLTEKRFGISDCDIVNAVRYHTSGREDMSELEKLIFLADMLEEERSYEGVDELRTLFWQGQGLDECLEKALFETIVFLEKKKADIYPLTRKAYEFYKKRKENYGRNHE